MDKVRQVHPLAAALLNLGHISIAAILVADTPDGGTEDGRGILPVAVLNFLQERLHGERKSQLTTYSPISR